VDCVIEIALLVRHPAGHVRGNGETCKDGSRISRLRLLPTLGVSEWWLEMT
jgi:hypothetical protein